MADAGRKDPRSVLVLQVSKWMHSECRVAPNLFIDYQSKDVFSFLIRQELTLTVQFKYS